MAGRYVAPECGTTPFTCPYCDTLAPQEAGEAGIAVKVMKGMAIRYADDSMYLTYCTSCGKKAVWVRHPDYRLMLGRLKAEGSVGDTETGVSAGDAQGDPPTVVTMVHPRTSIAPPPNDDLPEDIIDDYREAAGVLPISPRSSAALLRLCLQKLCRYFGQPGRDINKEIGVLVSHGTLRPMIQQAMDTVRIVGNESVHPGELNLSDDRELALSLFEFINLVADEAITQPRKADRMYQRLPESKRHGVEERDGTPNDDRV